MHYSAETLRFLVNLSSPLAMVVTQTTDLFPAGTASSQVHIEMQLWSDWVAEWRASHLWRYSIVGREVCFHGLLNCCYRTVQIRVRECQGYYVYELNPSPTERFSRYCASAWTLSGALRIRQDSINRQHALIIIIIKLYHELMSFKKIKPKKSNKIFSCPESSIQYARICVEILTRGLVRSVCPSLRRRRLEVVGERENGRARGRHC